MMCFDYHPLCSAWAAVGHCTNSRNFMTRYCQKSCDVCGDDGDDTDESGKKQNCPKIICTHCFWKQKLSVADPEFSRSWRQPIIWPIFPANWMKMKKFWVREGAWGTHVPLDPLMIVVDFSFILNIPNICTDQRYKVEKFTCQWSD